jgi:hypothetical protein
VANVLNSEDCLPALKIEKKKILFAKAVNHVLVMNLKDWIERSLQLDRF